MKKFKKFAALLMSAVLAVNIIGVADVKGDGYDTNVYQAELYYYDEICWYLSGNETFTDITGDGTYTLTEEFSLEKASWEYEENVAKGATWFDIMIPDIYYDLISINETAESLIESDDSNGMAAKLERYLGVSINLDSIKVDGKEVTIINERPELSVEDGSIWLHIYNTWTGGYPRVIDESEIEFSDKMEVTFTITGLDDALAGKPMENLVKTYGDYKYILLSDDEAEIIGYTGSDVKITIPSVVNGAKVTKIANRAFEENYDIEEVTVPEGVVSIGEYAFCDCDYLQSISLPDSLEVIGNCAFESCDFLSGVTVPDSVTEIGNGAFENCSSLESVQLSAGMTSISDYLFFSCWSLSEIVIPDGIEKIGDSAFGDCDSIEEIDLPDSLIKISYSAFGDCDSLNEVVLPDSVTEIESDAFESCDSLKKVTLSKNLLWEVYDEVDDDYSYVSHHFSNNPFHDCKSLSKIDTGSNKNYVTTDDGLLFTADYKTLIAFVGEKDSYTIPEGVEVLPYAFSSGAVKEISINSDAVEIGNYSFADCYSLEKVSIPEKVETIGLNAFSSCEALTEIVIPDSVTHIGGGAFEYCINMEKAILSKNLSSIEYNTFEDCTSLKEIVIPEGVTYIGSYAFWGCRSLTDVSLPKSLEIIYDHAFLECESLTEIEIPAGVTEIDTMAFSGCSALETIEVENSKTFKTVDGILFSADGKTLVAFAGQLDKYALPEGVTGISEYAFSSGNVAEVVLNDDIEKIGDSAFNDCYGLNKITIPSNVVEIGACAFESCNNLTDVVFEGEVKEIGEYAFESCNNLTDVVFEGEVKEIGEYAFAWCGNLTDIVFEGEVKEIGEYAFAWCYSLEEVVLPNGLQKISYGLFYDSNPDKVTIPETVTSIDDYAFYYNYGVVVEIPNSVTEIFASAFECAIDAVIRCYRGSYAHQYAADNGIRFSLIGEEGVPGDVNNSGDVTAIDARLVLQYIADNYELSDEAVLLADVNGDGDITAIDARLILQVAAGNIVLQ